MPFFLFLLQVDNDGNRLEPAQLGSFVAQLIGAGNDTTNAALAGGVIALAEHPEQWERLKSDPSLIPNAVEEILRWVSPIFYMRRTATRDIPLRGKTIRSGDKIVQWYVSGDRDEDLNEDPDTFDVARANVRHVAFGGGGFKLCLGAALSRLELRITLEELLRRVDTVRLAGAPKRRVTNWLTGWITAPVELDIAPASK